MASCPQRLHNHDCQNATTVHARRLLRSYRIDRWDNVLLSAQSTCTKLITAPIFHVAAMVSLFGRNYMFCWWWGSRMLDPVEHSLGGDNDIAVTFRQQLKTWLFRKSYSDIIIWTSIFIHFTVNLEIGSALGESWLIDWLIDWLWPIWSWPKLFADRYGLRTQQK